MLNYIKIVLTLDHLFIFYSLAHKKKIYTCAGLKKIIVPEEEAEGEEELASS